MAESSCPFCASELEEAYLYVRGFSTALFVSSRPNTSIFSRSGLTQIDLGAISESGAGVQAVIKALRCTACESISIRTNS